MSMDEISRVIGGMETTLTTVAADVRDIKDGKMRLCQEHGEDIKRLVDVTSKANGIPPPMPSKRIKIGKLQIDGYAGADVVKILLALTLLFAFLLRADKLVAKWVNGEKAIPVAVSEVRSGVNP